MFISGWVIDLLNMQETCIEFGICSNKKGGLKVWLVMFLGGSTCLCLYSKKGLYFMSCFVIESRKNKCQVKLHVVRLCFVEYHPPVNNEFLFLTFLLSISIIFCDH